MTIQELIDKLLQFEDKSMLVIREYDGWYNPIKELELKQLYTDDDYKNITDYKESESISFNGIILRD